MVLKTVTSSTIPSEGCLGFGLRRPALGLDKYGTIQESKISQCREPDRVCRAADVYAVGIRYGSSRLSWAVHGDEWRGLLRTESESSWAACVVL